MEKRKLIVNYNSDESKALDKNTYTFTIPNSNISDIKVSINKDKKKKEMKKNN